MISLPTTTTDMAVIDSDRAGYEALAGDHPSSLHFRSSGGEALRLAATEHIAVWWIAVELRDMSGFDLHDMLRERRDGATVYMVGETYRVEHNLLARRAGVAMYVCKPVHPSWLPPSPAAIACGLSATPDPTAACGLRGPPGRSAGPGRSAARLPPGNRSPCRSE
jgi:CheY-like chemotaxis protein